MTVTKDVSKVDFDRDGVALLEGFYDINTQLRPIQDGIRAIVSTVARKYSVTVPVATPVEAMTEGYSELIKINRTWGGEIYDAVKQIPGLLRLVADARNDRLFRRLRPDSIPGIAAGGFGIRIDNPAEHKFRAAWHQEFPAQLRSLDGVVFWTPLLDVTPEMGPVEVAVGSHAEGLVPVYEESPEGGRAGAYSLRLSDEEARLSRYPTIAPLTSPGDLLLMDFLTLHQSGSNVSKRPRWSIQFRMFNFLDPVGIKIGWKGSYADKTDFRSIMPELVA